MRTIFLLAAGLATGYMYGFRDAQTHEQPLQRRVTGQLVQKAGGASRDRVKTDVDERMRRAER